MVVCVFRWVGDFSLSLECGTTGASNQPPHASLKVILVNLVICPVDMKPRWYGILLARFGGIDDYATPLTSERLGPTTLWKPAPLFSLWPAA